MSSRLLNCEYVINDSPIEDRMSFSETVLMEHFTERLRDKLDSQKSPSPILIPEFEGVRGRPDLVCVRIRSMPEAISHEILANYLRFRRYTDLLIGMRYGSFTKWETFVKRSNYSKYDVKSRIHELSEVGLVNVGSDGSVSLGCRMPRMEVESYEGKLTNWRRALVQATTYKVFSHSVRIVMPAVAARHAKKCATIFRAQGFGLIAVESDWSYRFEYRSRKRRPHSRSIALLTAGKVLHRILTDDAINIQSMS